MLRTTLFVSSSLLVVTLAWLAGSPASADTLVLPTARENVEGDTANAGPFGKLSAEFNDPFRFQQVYAGTAFPALAIGEVVRIDELRFRPDLGSGSTGPSTSNDVEIRLWTTQKAVDGLDFTNLDLNVDGGDVTLVYAGSLTLTSCYCGAPTRNFDIVVDFQFPFYYDPSAGNLLIEVINESNPYPNGFFLDAHDNTNPEPFPDDPADETSRLAEVIDSSEIHTIVGQNISVGLVTQFVYTITVPEPSSALAGAVGVLALLALHRSS